ncbi:MAG: ATP-binding protein [Eggerthellaceae bacterium]|jgi:electron transport complex protein RnfB
MAEDTLIPLEDLTKPSEYDDLYRAYQERLDEMGFGYCKAQGDAAGAELVMLKRFYTPQDIKYILDMPIDEFFTAADFAKTEGMDEAQAFDILQDLAKRGNIYHEKRDDGIHYYHAEPAAHGIYEFHAGEFDTVWLGEGLYPTMANGMLAQVYDAGVPFYRCVPADEKLVKEGELLDDDDLFAHLRTHRRFCVSPCACVTSARDVLGMDTCDHESGVCIQTDEMADYYLDDLHLGKEITLEQCEKLLRRNVERGLAMQTTYAKKNEIICSCKLCHCGILQAAKAFPGDAMNNISRYEIEFDRNACTKSGACAARCTMQAITFDDDGYPVTDASCIGCGQCVIACKAGARILKRKPDEEIRELPDDVWGAYVEMEGFRKEKGMIPA